MDDTRINEDLLNTAVKLLFGRKAADKLRRTYAVLHAVAEQAAEDAWYEGHTAGVEDGKLAARFKADLADAGNAITEQEMADEAQLTMDALWG